MICGSPSWAMSAEKYVKEDNLKGLNITTEKQMKLVLFLFNLSGKSAWLICLRNQDVSTES